MVAPETGADAGVLATRTPGWPGGGSCARRRTREPSDCQRWSPCAGIPGSNPGCRGHFCRRQGRMAHRAWPHYPQTGHQAAVARGRARVSRPSAAGWASEGRGTAQKGAATLSALPRVRSWLAGTAMVSWQTAPDSASPAAAGRHTSKEGTSARWEDSPMTSGACGTYLGYPARNLGAECATCPAGPGRPHCGRVSRIGRSARHAGSTRAASGRNRWPASGAGKLQRLALEPADEAGHCPAPPEA